MSVTSLLSSLKRALLPQKPFISELSKIIDSNKFIDDTFNIEEPFAITIIDSGSSIHVSSNVHFRKFCNIIVAKGGRLDIGSNVFFNNYCSVNCLMEIVIGENTLFGEGVKIYDHNHLYSITEDRVLNVDRNEFKTGAVKIGKNCWIGSQVVILPNVSIGDNVIIGANNLIYKSIPPNVIVKQHSNTIIETL